MKVCKYKALRIVQYLLIALLLYTIFKPAKKKIKETYGETEGIIYIKQENSNNGDYEIRLKRPPGLKKVRLVYVMIENLNIKSKDSIILSDDVKDIFSKYVMENNKYCPPLKAETGCLLSQI